MSKEMSNVSQTSKTTKSSSDKRKGFANSKAKTVMYDDEEEKD